MSVERAQALIFFTTHSSSPSIINHASIFADSKQQQLVILAFAMSTEQKTSIYAQDDARDFYV